ncbi:hypothetical protein BDF14DRAFT_1741218 [Spinellus fusiger]|nr:hypothetical protein BDF14DRAFT_1741218 [Spinellus fusiger]
MQQFWPRVSIKSSRANYSLCKTAHKTHCISTKQLHARLHTHHGPPLSLSSPTRGYTATTASSAQSRNGESAPQPPTAVINHYLKTIVVQDKKNEPSLPIAKSKDKLTALVTFHRSLATQDIDLIWPIYTFFYANEYLGYITRHNYGQLIRFTVRARATQKNLFRFLAIIDDMKKLKMPLRRSEYNALMSWVGGKSVPSIHKHHLTEALTLFEEMKTGTFLKTKETIQTIDVEYRGMRPCLVTFNTLIHIATKMSDISTAQRLYYDMLAQKIDPDSYTYTTLIHGMGKMGDIGGVERMLDHLRENKLDYLINSTIAWNAIMSSYAHNGMYDKVFSMFKDMMGALKEQKKRGIKDTTPMSIPPADIESFRINIELLLWNRRFRDAKRSLNDIETYGIQPIAAIYNAFFAYFMQPSSDAPHSEHMLEHIPEKIKKDTLEALSTDPVYGEEEDEERMKTEEQEEQEEQKKNNERESGFDTETSNKTHPSHFFTYSPHTPLTTHTSSTIVQQLYASMRHKKVQPNSDTMYTLVSALLDLGETTLALETFVQLTNEASLTPPKLDLRASSIAVLAQQRFKITKKNPTRVEPNPLLFDRLNSLLSDN